MNAKVTATKVCPGCSARYPPDALFCPNDGSALSASPLGEPAHPSDPGVGYAGVYDSYLGREISGHIEIRKLAGVGAMGRVYRAFQRGIDRDVAVKVLHRELSANQQLVARFHREAKVASRLQHPNVVQVHLAGQLPDGAMYIVMEYLDGLSLQSALAAAGGPLPLERALHIALQICDAAGEAHAQGVIHRDIKPENVMLIRRGDDPDFVKVLDFGIARLNWGDQSMATAAGLIFGTARYISPEGAQGEAVGPEGDVYATATLLYQMLAGRTPFEGDQAVALLIQQIHDAPPPLRSLPGAANVPPAIASVIMNNLAKSPESRAPDARTFGRALVLAAKSVGLTAEDLVPRSSLFVPPARLSDPGVLLGSAAAGVAGEGGRTPTTVRDPATRDVTPAPLGPGTVPSGKSAKTQIWTPRPGEVGEAREVERDVPRATSAANPGPQAPFPASPNAYGASVDPTLDETSGVHAPLPVDPEPRVRTEMAFPLPSALPRALANLDPGSPVGPPFVQRAASDPGAIAPLPLPRLPTPPHAFVPLPATFGTSNVSDPSLGVDAARLVSNSVSKPERRPKRVLGVVILCFLLGMIGAAAGLYELGVFGSGANRGTLDDVVARADEALRQARWDTPPGDNVRDITTEGLVKWPGDARLKDLRARATDELVKEAVGRKFAGDLPGALHLAHLANELDPTDTTAQSLVDEYERDSKANAHDAAAVTAPSGGALPTAPHPGSRTPAPAGPAGPTGPKVVVEASIARPKVGQPVTFTAKVSTTSGPWKTIEDPRFVINGPGLAADTKLGAIPEGGGTYIATFAGFEQGKYDVTFDAKVDGSLVRGTRSTVVEGDAPTPASPSRGAPSATPLPSTAPSAKWL